MVKGRKSPEKAEAPLKPCNAAMVAKGVKGFTKGVSGNPAGRPRGSLNKTTLLVQSLLEDEAENLMRAMIERAKDGDTHAQKFCLDRLIPPLRARPLKLILPKIETVTDLKAASDAMFESLAAGDITLDECERLTRLLESKRALFETLDLAEELARIKNHLECRS